MLLISTPLFCRSSVARSNKQTSNWGSAPASLYGVRWLINGSRRSGQRSREWAHSGYQTLVNDRILLIGQSIPPTFPSFARMTERRSTSPGWSALLPVPRRTLPRLANRKPETCSRGVFIAYFRLQKLSAIRYSFSVPGAVVLLPIPPAACYRFPAGS